MNNVQRLEFVALLIETGAARILYTDDKEDFDDWGKIPPGYSIRVRACESYTVHAATLPECIDRAMKFEKLLFEREA